jgi:hypothetical protein
MVSKDWAGQDVAAEEEKHPNVKFEAEKRTPKGQLRGGGRESGRSV